MAREHRQGGGIHFYRLIREAVKRTFCLLDSEQAAHSHTEHSVPSDEQPCSDGGVGGYLIFILKRLVVAVVTGLRPDELFFCFNVYSRTGRELLSCV